MKHFAILLLSMISISSFAQSYDIKSTLRELDLAIQNHSYYVEQHQMEIDQVKKDMQYAQFDNDRYIINKKLYALYKKFDGDSAIAYAQRNYKLGVKNNNIAWQKEAQLNIAQIQVIRGVLFLAKEHLEKMGSIDSLPIELRAPYAVAVLNYNHKVRKRPIFNGVSRQTENFFMNDSLKLLSYIHKGTLRYCVVQSIMGNFSDEVLNETKRCLSLVEPDNNNDLSKAYFILAQCCQAKGDADGYIYYLAKASICDMKMVNRGSQSILKLIEVPMIQDDIDRAYKYAMQCEQDAKAFKDYNRSVDILSAQDIIIKSYQNKQDRQQILIFGGLLLVLVLCIVITLMFLNLRKKARRQRDFNLQLNALNKEQQQSLEKIKHMTSELENTNSKLLDEIKLRDNNFIAPYYLCSDYVKALQNFKKTIVNLLKTNSYKEALKKASSTEINDQELKDFYKRFDEAFLSTRSDFVERFNRLLKPEGQFVLENPNVLTPELRIYALISLGITNSVNIADFLHYSPQTIYNYRLRVRHQSLIDESKFAEAVTNIYDDAKLKSYFE